MRNFKFGIFILLFLKIFLFTGCEGRKLTSIFEPGNISTSLVEFSSSLSSSGNEIYFARSDQKWGKGDMKSSIYYSVKKK